MKLLAIGDIHGCTIWKEIIKKENPDRVVFIGDYFDTFDDISTVEQMRNFEDIIEFKHSGIDVTILIGNHDYHYFPEIGDNGTGGYQRGGASVSIGFLLNENRRHLKMCHKEGDFLFSHAGISKVWLQQAGWNEKEDIEQFVNDAWQYKPLLFQFYGLDQSGDSVTQTPIWIRPTSLIRTWHKDKNKPTQIVGHTAMKKLDIKGKHTGGKFFFIDTLGTTKEYLIIKNGIISVGQI